MKKLLSAVIILVYSVLSGQVNAQPPKLIDVHIHCYDSSRFATPFPVLAGNIPSKNTVAHFNDTYAALRKAGAVKAIISGSPSAVESWMQKDSLHLFIRGIAMDGPTDFGMDTLRFEQMIKDKKIEVFGEVGTYYSGTTLSDSVWQPYLRICEKYDIPVAVHEGGGPPETPYRGSPKARLRLADPFLIEDVLVKYPRLRIYLMHAGEVWYEHGLRLMMMYPQLYADIAALLWVTSYNQRYVTAFLKEAKEAGCLNRVMFGSDQMKWPGAIESSLRFFNSLSFLTKAEKEDVLYNNAARFFRLER